MNSLIRKTMTAAVLLLACTSCHCRHCHTHSHADVTESVKDDAVMVEEDTTIKRRVIKREIIVE